MASAYETNKNAREICTEIDLEAREQIMSVQFGRWNFEGQPPALDYIEKVSAALAPYGPDSSESYSKDGIRILYRAFHTTKESRHEKQPCISPSCAVITWDGRLDNRADLISELRGSLTVSSTDVAIVAMAYEKWGTNCLGKLIGDWALSIWNPHERSVLLAKDPIGTKHLYYSFDDKQLTWSTILDPIVLLAGRTFKICEEYIAGWFASYFPAAHLTPYVGVHAVAPSSSVVLRPGKHIIGKYWDFDPSKRIRYRTDAEYEKHFRSVLATSVQRRLRSDRPVLAELSGGMDSSSIVCMADVVIDCGTAECPRLDTLTWFDESKPNWGELPHFTKVEEKRGRIGHHINAAALREDHSPISFGAEFSGDRFAATPVPNRHTSEFFKQNASYINSQGYRVTLSGIGGEVTGDGVPTPTPEFQNLLARARFVPLTRQLKAWAAKMGKKRMLLLWDAIRGFALQDIPEYVNPAAPWFHPDFTRRNRASFRDYSSRIKLFGPLPSFQDHIAKLSATRRFVASRRLHSELLREIRYPYYDRDLLEFMYAIPREQIVRVGQRRSLMKRALVGIVPYEILNRRKKKTAPTEPKKDSSTDVPGIAEIGQHITKCMIGVVDPDRFTEALRKARREEDVPIGSLNRTLTLESWLRHLTLQGVLTNPVSTMSQEDSSSLEAKELQPTGEPKSLAS
jgi:asparagine synthase (glutamine-hydrolysing)